MFKLIHAIRFREIAPFVKSAGVLLIALVFAVLTNITTLWATWEYGKYSIRGKSELSTAGPEKTARFSSLALILLLVAAGVSTLIRKRKNRIS